MEKRGKEPIGLEGKRVTKMEKVFDPNKNQKLNSGKFDVSVASPLA